MFFPTSLGCAGCNTYMEGEVAKLRDLIREGHHVVAKFDEFTSGRTLIVVGGLHGNEPSGVKAVRNVAKRLSPLQKDLKGRVYFLAGNSRALRRKVRFIGADLNRHWKPANLYKLENRAEYSEDVELFELKRILEKILASARDEVFVLDLHTTSAGGKPFATVGDTLRNRHFAQRFPITILLGIEEQLEGTLLEYLNGLGTVTLGFEGGQHDAVAAIHNHEALIWLSLSNSGILSPELVPDLNMHRAMLRASTESCATVEVRYRKALMPGEKFIMNPGYNNFDPVEKGEALAVNKYGPIEAIEGGMILMPLYQTQGEDGFFIGRKVAGFWIWLSEILRRAHVSTLMPLLPGVRRHPADRETLLVNTRTARFFPLQIFHLLGFRRRRWSGNTLVVSRRRYDTRSPFVKA